MRSGLTIGGAEAATALVRLLRSPPSVPARTPPLGRNIDEQAAAIPPIAHALAQCAPTPTPVPLEEHFRGFAQTVGPGVFCTPNV